MKMYLEAAGRLIDTGQRYDDLQDTKKDYPWTVFETTVRNGMLITKVITGNIKRTEMKGAGRDGWYY